MKKTKLSKLQQEVIDRLSSTPDSYIYPSIYWAHQKVVNPPGEVVMYFPRSTLNALINKGLISTKSKGKYYLTNNPGDGGAEQE